MALWMKILGAKQYHQPRVARSSVARFEEIRGICTAVLALCLGLLWTQGASAQTDSRCYDSANAQTVGDPSWTGCANMYIVKDRIELLAAVQGGAPFRISSGGTDYTFADSAHNVFTGQVTDMRALFSSQTSFNDDIGYWDTSNTTLWRSCLLLPGNLISQLGIGIPRM